MATYKPILFSTPMVQALLEGRKKMTRRTKGMECVNASPFQWRFDEINEDGDYAMEMLQENGEPAERYKEVVPMYRVGDVLWVRETFEEVPVETASVNGSDSVVEKRIQYKADQTTSFVRWKPSIFMPKSACRIFLEVKKVRAERVQDISEYDAYLEGVQLMINKDAHLVTDISSPNNAFSFLDINPNNWTPHQILKAYWAELWCKINGRDSWDVNPWVWVYEFERIERPSDFT